MRKSVGILLAMFCLSTMCSVSELDARRGRGGRGRVSHRAGGRRRGQRRVHRGHRRGRRHGRQGRHGHAAYPFSTFWYPWFPTYQSGYRAYEVPYDYYPGVPVYEGRVIKEIAHWNTKEVVRELIEIQLQIESNVYAIRRLAREGTQESREHINNLQKHRKSLQEEREYGIKRARELRAQGKRIGFFLSKEISNIEMHYAKARAKVSKIEKDIAERQAQGKNIKGLQKKREALREDTFLVELRLRAARRIGAMMNGNLRQTVRKYVGY